MKFEEDSPVWGPRLMLRLVELFFLKRSLVDSGCCHGTSHQNRPGVVSFAAPPQWFGLMLGTEIERIHEDHHHVDVAAAAKRDDLFAEAPQHQHAVNIVDLAVLNIVDDYAPVFVES